MDTIQITVSEAGRKVIVRAFHRGEPYFVCPTPGLHNAAQEAVLNKLAKDGLINYTGENAATLTKKGINVANDS